MEYGKRMPKPGPAPVFGGGRLAQQVIQGSRVQSGFAHEEQLAPYSARRRETELVPESAADRKLANMGWFNVKDYGALGDGVANDTDAIEDAIDAAVAAGGGIVYFPVGTYLISRTLPVPDWVSYQGDGMAASIISATGGLTTMFSQSYTTATEPPLCGFRDLMIYGNAVATRGVVLTRVNYIHFHRVQFKGYSASGARALYLTDCFWTVVFGCYFNDCHTACIEMVADPVGCSQSQIIATELDATNRTSCRALIVTGQNITIRDCDIEGGSDGDLGVDIRKVEGVFIQNCYIERWVGSAITVENATTSVGRIVIENNMIHSDSATNVINLNHATITPTNIVVRSNRFPDDLAATQRCIRIGNATRVRYGNNDNPVAKLTENYTAGITQLGPDVGMALVRQDTYDPANVTNGNNTAVEVTVVGAEIGDPVTVGFSANAAGNAIIWSGYVSAADTVRVMIHNVHGADVNLGSGTLTVMVWKVRNR